MSVATGQEFELTEEMRKQPGVYVYEFLPEELQAMDLVIDQEQKNNPPPKPPVCKDTCRSCKKKLEKQADDLANDLRRCRNAYSVIAVTRCTHGEWRADPRGPGEAGTPVEKCYYDDVFDGDGSEAHPHSHRVCRLTQAMTACRNSWTHDLPPGTSGSANAGIGINIGVISGSFGGSTQTTTIEGRQGYDKGCEVLNSQAAAGPASEYMSCVKGVEDAHPGVTCTVED